MIILQLIFAAVSFHHILQIPDPWVGGVPPHQKIVSYAHGVCRLEKLTRPAMLNSDLVNSRLVLGLGNRAISRTHSSFPGADPKGRGYGLKTGGSWGCPGLSLPSPRMQENTSQSNNDLYLASVLCIICVAITVIWKIIIVTLFTNESAN